MKTFLIAAAPIALLISSPAIAQFASGNEPAPGYSSLLKSDYSAAEREIREANMSPYEPARAINLGVVLAKTGRREEAVQQFLRVLQEDNVQLVVADGKTLMSHDVAQKALAAMNNGVLAR